MAPNKRARQSSEDKSPVRSEVGDDADSQRTEPDFNQRWGYVPPFDKKMAALIEAIIANPALGKEFRQTGPGHGLFPRGLMLRNIFCSESEAADPITDYIHARALTPSRETVDEDGTPWRLDQIARTCGSNNTLFLGTLLMSLITQIYESRLDRTRYLDFSMENAWTCPPMPTRAYEKEVRFLTQPKPDLAVCFCREAVINNNLWSNMPAATMRLACYENEPETTGEKIFHFFTIEVSPDDDTVGKLQSLNNASQALHNMFEFFKDAGPEHEELFFEKVRFFSVVASTEGLIIRIHRATRGREDASDMGLIMPNRSDYPLQFEHEEFAKVGKRDFHPVVNTFERILVGYGINMLLELLSNAAKAIMTKLDEDPWEMKQRENRDFYRYGQI